jgi:cytoskeletal protein RodZ
VAGQYHVLPGDPYVRALFVSVAKKLQLDPQILIQAYAEEMGATVSSPQVAPYRDQSHTHQTAHKKFFIVLVVALLVVLAVVLSKVGALSESGEADSIESNSGDFLPPPLEDTVPDSPSLIPDSASEGMGAPSPAPTSPSLSPAKAPPADTLSVAPKTTPNEMTTVLKPVLDSVTIRILRFGKKDAVHLLALGKQMQVTHSDTITLVVDKRRGVEVNLGGKTLIPDRKMFKIIGNELIYF